MIAAALGALKYRIQNGAGLAPTRTVAFSFEALAKRLRVAGCIYTTMRSQVALGGVTDLVGDLWVEFSAGAAFPSALGP